MREFRRDAAGDPLNIPNEIFERWLNVADRIVEKNKVNLRSNFDIVVYKSLDSEDIVKKQGEDVDDYLKRVQDMDSARRDYSSRAISDDHDVEKNLIRGIDLSS